CVPLSASSCCHAPATTATSTLSLHDALPISAVAVPGKRLVVYKTPWCGCCGGWAAHMRQAGWTVEVVEREDLAPIRARHGVPDRSEEHTSELQSRENLVCRLLLEKKNTRSAR